MQNERKKLEELNLLDDFLFNARPHWGRTPCRENKETKFVLKVF